MRPLPEIVRDFFRTTDLNVRYEPLIGSARLALRAYVSTANIIHGRLDLTAPGANAQDQELHDFNLPATYRDAAFESIVHFQHFAELVLKEVLRAKHELLVAITGDHHVLLSRLVDGEALGAEDAEGLYAIEASVALQRTCALLQAGRLDASWNFIRTSREFLQQINALRNRLWHRGTLVLRYRALDELIGGYALPLLFEVMRQPSHAQHATLWKHQPLHCGLDPLPLIAGETRNENWSVERVAFLKELARAANETRSLRWTSSRTTTDDSESERRRWPLTPPTTALSK